MAVNCFLTALLIISTVCTGDSAARAPQPAVADTRTDNNGISAVGRLRMSSRLHVPTGRFHEAPPNYIGYTNNLEGDAHPPPSVIYGLPPPDHPGLYGPYSSPPRDPESYPRPSWELYAADPSTTDFDDPEGPEGPDVADEEQDGWVETAHPIEPEGSAAESQEDTGLAQMTPRKRPHRGHSHRCGGLRIVIDKHGKHGKHRKHGKNRKDGKCCE